MTVRAKWRPPLALLVAGLVSLVFVLPAFAMVLVVMVSRTPGELLLSLQENWGRIALALAVVGSLTILTGYVFWRGLTKPLRALAARADDVANGAASFDVDGPYGTREVAQLADNFAVVVDRLKQRSQYLETLSAHLVHELKSPLTSILGAAELLRDETTGMDPQQRRHFLGNIIGDAEHLTALSSRLRDLAQADIASGRGTADIGDLVAALAADFPDLEIQYVLPPSARFPLSQENAGIVMHHLADNALCHGATVLTLRSGPGDSIDVINDGEAIREDIGEDVFTPFFTTRRHSGGTGLGLAISAALIASAKGQIELHSTKPVTFRITISN